MPRSDFTTVSPEKDVSASNEFEDTEKIAKSEAERARGLEQRAQQWLNVIEKALADLDSPNKTQLIRQRRLRSRLT